MLADEKLNQLLKKASDNLQGKTYHNNTGELRSKLEDNACKILPLQALSPDTIKKLAGGRPAVAVDGSVNWTGSAFPHVIYLFQAYAKSSPGEGVVLSDLFSPLLPEYNQRLAEIAAEESLNREEALGQVKNRILTSLELQAASRAIEKYSPWLVMFDGGFMRFSRHAPEEWEHYCRLARSAGVLSVGIIEEAESFGLSTVLDIKDSRELPVYDRELLFGLLEPGECLLLPREKQIKSEFYTVFCRLAGAPQAAACDFLPEASGEDIQNIMHFLYTVTPSGSRGIPLLLDIVDAEVRITRKEMELLFSAYLDAGTREKFFVPHRSRRDY